MRSFLQNALVPSTPILLLVVTKKYISTFLMVNQAKTSRKIWTQMQNGRVTGPGKT